MESQGVHIYSIWGPQSQVVSGRSKQLQKHTISSKQRKKVLKKIITAESSNGSVSTTQIKTSRKHIIYLKTVYSKIFYYINTVKK